LFKFIVQGSMPNKMPTCHTKRRKQQDISENLMQNNKQKHDNYPSTTPTNQHKKNVTHASLVILRHSPPKHILPLCFCVLFLFSSAFSPLFSLSRRVSICGCHTHRRSSYWFLTCRFFAGTHKLNNENDRQNQN